MPPQDTMRNHEEEEQRQPVLAENLFLKVGTVGASLGLIVFMVAWLVLLRSDVTTLQRDVSSIKQGMGSLGNVNEIQRYGSDLARQNAKDILELKSKVAQDMADLRKELDLHEARDKSSWDQKKGPL